MKPPSKATEKKDYPSDAILFYGSRATLPYGSFSNFGAYTITMDGASYPTVEHYFQAMKFVGTSTARMNKIRTAATPMQAAALGRDRKISIRSDWDSVKDDIMYQGVLAKFSTHADLRALLLSTQNRLLVEHTPRDKYWGDGGGCGRGKNMLGQTLMRVRETLRKEEEGGKKTLGKTSNSAQGQQSPAVEPTAERTNSCRKSHRSEQGK